MTMKTESQWNEIIQEHELAYFRADICLGSPRSYSLEEKKQICEGMEASTRAVDAMLREDFNSMPSAMQLRMLDMLGAPGTPERTWWEDILLDFDSLSETANCADAS